MFKVALYAVLLERELLVAVLLEALKLAFLRIRGLFDHWFW